MDPDAQPRRPASGAPLAPDGSAPMHGGSCRPPAALISPMPDRPCAPSATAWPSEDSAVPVPVMALFAELALRAIRFNTQQK
jgi:hypothetical protein